ncbi:MAG: hypothetical protein FWF10_09070 [Clostridiales bacterium]|nr:hypothetical protein [Clostridiales bacterium]
MRIFRGDTSAYICHELLHLFGGVDLYAEAVYKPMGVSAEFLKYVEKNYLNDIMRVQEEADAYGYLSYTIDALEISPITAYRLGWLDTIPELKQFPNFRLPGDMPGIWAPYSYMP